MKFEFPFLKSVRVLVEERRTGGAASRAGDWRTHEYSGLEAVPERLRPAFASPGTCAVTAEVDVLALLRLAYAEGLQAFHHEADYTDGAGCDKATVRRTVAIHLSYKSPVRTGQVMAMAAGLAA